MVWILYFARVFKTVCLHYTSQTILFTFAIILVGIWFKVNLPFLGNPVISPDLAVSYYLVSTLPFFSIANKQLKNFKETSFYKGVSKGLSVEILPNKVKIYYYLENKIF